MAQGVCIDEKKLAALCKAHNILRLSLFGSALTDGFTEKSDIDVLVEFQPGKTPGLLGMVQIEDELGKLMGGRRIDLKTPKELSRYFRQQVLSDAKVQYAG
jgi:uncharacterized protein